MRWKRRGTPDGSLWDVAIWAIPVIVLIALPLLLAPAEKHAGAEPSPDDRLAEPAGAIGP